jgi:hypothetical protein
MRHTFPSPEASEPAVIVASDASMSVVALSAAAMREVVSRWPKLQPKPAPRPMDEQVAELGDAAKADPVLARMFPSLGI